MVRTEEGTPPPRGEFKDRRAGLVLFGILAIVVGSFLGLISLLTPAALVAGSAVAPAQGSPPVDVRTAATGTIFYAAIAALFIWIGVGSIRMRRWVRPIALIVAWTWLLTGLIMLIFWLLMLPNLRAMVEAAQPGEAPLEAGAYTLISLIASAFIVLAYVVLPAAFVWFYQDRSVRATLELHDPIPRWTDRCPIAILGLSLGLWVGSALSLIGLAYSVVPLFGFVLTGMPAAGLLVLLAAACAWTGLETYRLRMRGWWGVVTLTLALTGGQILTLLRVDLLEIYTRFGIPEGQLEAVRPYSGAATAWAMLICAVVGLACLGYMLYVKRYFLPGAPESR